MKNLKIAAVQFVAMLPDIKHLKNPTRGKRLVVVLVALVTTTACKKDRPSPQPAPAKDNITINDISYPTIVIGKQRWTAANYSGSGGLTIESSKNRPGYGKLYSQEEALALSLPFGWRVPAPGDYRELCRATGILLPEKGNSEQTAIIEKLMSSESIWTHGAGTNTSGFNAVPAGYIYVDLAVGQGLSAKLMTSEKVGTVRTYFHITRYTNSTTAGLRSVSTPEYTGLRFVKDEE
jgi:uncharacterized protein (TIGR02145 family)